MKKSITSATKYFDELIPLAEKVDTILSFIL